jgi:dTDP-4-dehydrorhamnose 3,5-epimerase
MKTLKLYQTKIHTDSRGIFSRNFDVANPDVLDFNLAQANISYNPSKATLRGMHYQISGPPEDKIVCLLSGSVFMAIVDLRGDSPTFMQKTELDLSSPLKEAIYIPSGYATGWISTSSDTSLQYLMSTRYEECTYSGISFDDSSLGINWPLTPKVISEQDLNWPKIQNPNMNS